MYNDLPLNYCRFWEVIKIFYPAFSNSRIGYTHEEPAVKVVFENDENGVHKVLNKLRTILENSLE